LFKACRDAAQSGKRKNYESGLEREGHKQSPSSFPGHLGHVTWTFLVRSWMAKRTAIHLGVSRILLDAPSGCDGKGLSVGIGFFRNLLGNYNGDRAKSNYSLPNSPRR
jgi:hypothetical protein